MPALAEQKILINCEAGQWQYKLDKASIKVDTFQRFQKKAKGVRIYALIEVNHLISSRATQSAGSLPDCL